MLTGVWERLRDRLSSIDSSTSMIEVTVEYAAHFYDMYIEGHTGKHLSGDRIRILLLNLPFLFRDLIAPKVVRMLIYLTIYKNHAMISFMISYIIYDMIS